MDSAQFQALVRELAALPEETEWMERKYNKAIPDEIGQYISALSNSSALIGRPRGYIIWGIENGSGRIAGTSFYPHQTRIGNEELENWLVTQLSPRIDVRIHEAEVGPEHVVIFEIQPAPGRPVCFKDTAYIRVGSYKKKLRDHPEKERALWNLGKAIPFEREAAMSDVPTDELLSLLDYPSYFFLMKQPLPENRDSILERLAADLVIHRNVDGRYDIANAGAVLFARDLTRFDRLARKSLRVIIYRGENRIETIREQLIHKGYAIAFEEIIRYINDQLPQNEELGQAFRREVRTFPEVAIRELVANALIHQDFTITGAGPTVEIFSGRMEITNPGAALIDTLRFIDEPPRSRNEALASLMRRMNMCEERGSGIDKVISSIELFQLPAPDFRVTTSSTIATLFAPRTFSQMGQQERVRACYQHACLFYVSAKRMSNATLRKRLGIEDKSYPVASRVIRDAIRSKLIKPYTQGEKSRKDATYVPFWG